MRDVVAHLDRWRAEGTASATATVVAVKRSAPRPPGAKMAVAADGTVQGMVSGGCVEGAVVLAAEEVLEGGPPRLLHFGIADEEAWEVGLPCGGEIGVWVDRVEGAAMERFGALAREGGRGALITRLDDGAKLLVEVDGARTGSLGSPALDDAAVAEAEELMWAERSAQRELEGLGVFVDATAPPPRLLIVGAVDLARALCRLARVMGWEPYVADPRGRFATAERFPEAERVIAAWPAKAFAQLGPIDRSTVDRDPHPRPEDRRCRAGARAALRGRLRRCDGLAAHAGHAAGAAARARAVRGRARADGRADRPGPRRAQRRGDRAGGRREIVALRHGRDGGRSRTPRAASTRSRRERARGAAGRRRPLAAGRARASARPKQLAELEGRPLVLHALGRLLCLAQLERVLVVVGAHADAVGQGRHRRRLERRRARPGARLGGGHGGPRCARGSRPPSRRRRRGRRAPRRPPAGHPARHGLRPAHGLRRRRLAARRARPRDLPRGRRPPRRAAPRAVRARSPGCTATPGRASCSRAPRPSASRPATWPTPIDVDTPANLESLTR
jgi:xanthine dehydrogenase accessory factor